MNKLHLRILLLWLFATAFAPAPAVAQQPTEFINAYVFGIRAEQAESAGRLIDALGLWEESLQMYQESLRLHPDWTPSVVNYRITTTANQIERVKGLVAEENKRKQAEAAAAIQAQIDQAVEKAQAIWQEEKNALDQRFAALVAEHAAMLESNRVFESELKGNRELIAELESTIATREKRIQRLEEGRDDAKEQTMALRADMAAKDEQIALLKEQLTNVPPPIISAEDLETLRNELSARTAEAAEQHVAAAEMLEKMNKLADQVSQLQTEKQDALVSHEEKVRSLEQAGIDLQQQMALKDEAIADLQHQLANQPAPIISAEDLETLRNELTTRMSEAADQQLTISSMLEKMNNLSDQVSQLQKEKQGAVAKHEKKVKKLEQASVEMEQQLELNEETIADLQRHIANQPPPVMTAEEILALQASIEAMQQELDQQEARRQALEKELAAANLALEAAQREPVVGDQSDVPSADYEKTKVENIVFRDAIQSMSNQIAVLSKQVSFAADQLAREQDNWNNEQARLNERMNALMETVDLNQAEISKVKDLRATIKQLEKENRQLTKQVDSIGSSDADKE
jgi:chromosome segregation ATPase